MTTLTPTYLHCKDATSDKFYIVCPLPDGKTALTGWGKNSVGTAGQWKSVSLAEGRAKQADKLREGYGKVAHSALPMSAIKKMLAQIKSASGMDGTVQNDGTIKIGSGATTRKPTNTPGRVKGNRDQIHIWLGGVRSS